MHRADQALAETGFDAMLVYSGSPPTQFLDDQDYPYKVNPHFKAWLPLLENPGCYVIYQPGSRPRLLFRQPADFWHTTASAPPGPWNSAFEFIAVEDTSAAAAYWSGLGRTVFIGDGCGITAPAGGAVNDAGVLARLHYGRAVKSPYELACMRRANALGARGHLAALAAFRNGASEYCAHMRYLEACRQREEEMPYNNIVAYNEHAAVLHYQHLAREAPVPLRSFLIDAGAQYRGYAADITRSYAAGPGLFADLIAATDIAQRRLCGEIIAGRDYRDVHLSAHRVLGDAMRDIGLINVSGDEAVERGITRVFFPHGIGHLLGLQVHDVGGVMGDLQGGEMARPEGHPYLRLTRMLEPGVVVTVEPGIYFISSLLAAAKSGPNDALIDWRVVEELRPYGGVRIEDNVVATANEPENMTRDAFAALAA
ncbi:MAG: Xaa-Pro dipeptidase [Pseudomonadota bacterium]|nr:Xaa-Pro dipeptidase [Pseudomonadota bacterium]